MFLDTAPADVLTVNATFFIELAAFLVMLAVLWRYAYPAIEQAAESRQRAIAEALEGAEKARAEAEERLQQAEKRLDDARAQAQEVIAGAAKSGDQLREELREKGEEEYRRQVGKAVKDIEAARQQAVQSVRNEVAEIVVTVTEKVIGDVVDVAAHRKLIDKAIREVGVGQER